KSPYDAKRKKAGHARGEVISGIKIPVEGGEVEVTGAEKLIAYGYSADADMSWQYTQDADGRIYKSPYDAKRKKAGHARGEVISGIKIPVEGGEVEVTGAEKLIPYGYSADMRWQYTQIAEDGKIRIFVMPYDARLRKPGHVVGEVLKGIEIPAGGGSVKITGDEVMSPIGYDKDYRWQFTVKDGKIYVAPYDAKKKKAGDVEKRVEGIKVLMGTVEGESVDVEYYRKIRTQIRGLSAGIERYEFICTIPAQAVKGKPGRYYAREIDIETGKSKNVDLKIEGIWDGENIVRYRMLERYRYFLIEEGKYEGNYKMYVDVMLNGTFVSAPSRTGYRLGEDTDASKFLAELTDEWAKECADGEREAMIEGEKKVVNVLGDSANERLLNGLFNIQVNIETHTRNPEPFLQEVLDRASSMKSGLNKVLKSKGIIEQEMGDEVIEKFLYWAGKEDPKFDFAAFMEESLEVASLDEFGRYLNARFPQLKDLPVVERHENVFDILCKYSEMKLRTGVEKDSMREILKAHTLLEQKRINVVQLKEKIEEKLRVLRISKFWGKIGQWQKPILAAIIGFLMLFGVIRHAYNRFFRVSKQRPQDAGHEDAGHGFAPNSVLIPLTVSLLLLELMVSAAGLTDLGYLSFFAALIAPLSYVYGTLIFAGVLTIITLIPAFGLARSLTLFYYGVKANMFVGAVGFKDARRKELTFSERQKDGRYDTEAFQALPEVVHPLLMSPVRSVLQFCDWFLEMLDITGTEGILKKITKKQEPGDVMKEVIRKIVGETHPGKVLQNIIRRHENVRNHWLGIPALFVPLYDKVLAFMGLSSGRYKDRPEEAAFSREKARRERREDIAKGAKIAGRSNEERARDTVKGMISGTKSAFLKSHHIFNRRYVGEKPPILVEYRWNLWGMYALGLGFFILYNNLVKVWTAANWLGWGSSVWIVTAIFLGLGLFINRKYIRDKAPLLGTSVSGITLLTANLLQSRVINSWAGFWWPIWFVGGGLVILNLYLKYFRHMDIRVPRARQEQALGIVKTQLEELVGNVNEYMSRGGDGFTADQWKEFFRFPVQAPLAGTKDAVSIMVIEMDMMGYLKYCLDWITFLESNPDKDKYLLFSQSHAPPYDQQRFLPTFWVKGPLFTAMRTQNGFTSYKAMETLTSLQVENSDLPAVGMTIEKAMYKDGEELEFVGLMPGSETRDDYNFSYEKIGQQVPHNGKLEYKNSYQTLPWDNIPMYLAMAMDRVTSIKDRAARSVEEGGLGIDDVYRAPQEKFTRASELDRNEKLYTEYRAVDSFKGFGGPGSERSSYIKFKERHGFNLFVMSVIFAAGTYISYIGKSVLMAYDLLPGMGSNYSFPIHFGSTFLVMVTLFLFIGMIIKVNFYLASFFGNPEAVTDRDIMNDTPPRILAECLRKVKDKFLDEKRIIPRALRDIERVCGSFNDALNGDKQASAGLDDEVKNIIRDTSVEMSRYSFFGFSSLYRFLLKKFNILMEEKPTLRVVNRLRLDTPLISIMTLLNRERDIVIEVLEDRGYLTAETAGMLRQKEKVFTNEDILEYLSFDEIETLVAENPESASGRSLLPKGIVMNTTFGPESGENLLRMAKSAVESYPGGVDIYLVCDNDDDAGLMEIKKAIEKIRNDPVFGGAAVAKRIFVKTFPEPGSNMGLNQRTPRMKPSADVKMVMAVQYDYVQRHKEPPIFVELVDQEDVLGKLNLMTKVCIREIRSRHIREQLHKKRSTEAGERWGVDYDSLAGRLESEYDDFIDAFTKRAGLREEDIDELRGRAIEAAQPLAISADPRDRVRYQLWSFLQAAGTKDEFVQKEFVKRTASAVMQSELRQVDIKDSGWSTYSYMDYLIWHSAIQTGETRVGFLFLGGTGNNFDWSDLSGVVPVLGDSGELKGFKFLNWRHHFAFLLRPLREQIHKEETDGVTGPRVSVPSFMFREWINKYTPTGVWDLFNIIEDSELGSRIALLGQKCTRLEGIYTQILEDKLPADGIKWWLQRSRWISLQTFSAVTSYRPAAWMFWGQHIFGALGWALVGSKLNFLGGVAVIAAFFYVGGWAAYGLGRVVNWLLSKAGPERNAQWQVDPLKTMGWWRFQNMTYLSAAAFAGIAAGITFLVTTLSLVFLIFQFPCFASSSIGIFQLLTYLSGNLLHLIYAMENWLITLLMGIIFFASQQFFQSIMGFATAIISASEDEEGSRQALWSRIEDKGFSKLFGFDGAWPEDVGIDDYRNEEAINRLLERYRQSVLSVLGKDPRAIQRLLIRLTPFIFEKSRIKVILLDMIRDGNGAGDAVDEFLSDEWSEFLKDNPGARITDEADFDEFYEFIEQRARKLREDGFNGMKDEEIRFILNSWEELNARRKGGLTAASLESIQKYRTALMQAATEARSIWKYAHGAVGFGPVLATGIIGALLSVLAGFVAIHGYVIPAFIAWSILPVGIFLIINSLILLPLNLMDYYRYTEGKTPLLKTGRLAMHGIKWFLLIPCMLAYFNGMIQASCMALYTAASTWVNEAYWLRGRQRGSVSILPGDRATLANYVDIWVLKAKAMLFAWALIIVAFFTIVVMPYTKEYWYRTVAFRREPVLEHIYGRLSYENVAWDKWNLGMFYQSFYEEAKKGDISGLISAKFGLREKKKMFDDAFMRTYKASLIAIRAYSDALRDLGKTNDLDSQRKFKKVIEDLETFCYRHERPDLFLEYFEVGPEDLLTWKMDTTGENMKVKVDKGNKRVTTWPSLKKEYLWFYPDALKGNVATVEFTVPDGKVVDMKRNEFVFHFYVPARDMDAFIGRSVKGFYVDSNGELCNVGMETELIQYMSLPDKKREEGSLVRINVAPDFLTAVKFNKFARKFIIRIDGNINAPTYPDDYLIIEDPRVQRRVSLEDERRLPANEMEEKETGGIRVWLENELAKKQRPSEGFEQPFAPEKILHPFRAASAFRFSKWTGLLGVGMIAVALVLKVWIPAMPLWQVLTLVFAGFYFGRASKKSYRVGGDVYHTLIASGLKPEQALRELVARATPVGFILEPVFKLIKNEKIKREIIKHEYVEHKVLEFFDKFWSLRHLFADTQVAHKVAMLAMLPGISMFVIAKSPSAPLRVNSATKQSYRLTKQAAKSYVSETEINRYYSLYKSDFARRHAERAERIAALLASSLIAGAETKRFQELAGKIKLTAALHDLGVPREPIDKMSEGAVRKSLKAKGIYLSAGVSRDTVWYNSLIEIFNKRKSEFTDREIEIALDLFQGPAALRAIAENGIQISRSQKTAILFHHHIDELEGYLALQGWSEEEKQVTRLIASILVAADTIENGMNLFKKKFFRGVDRVETPSETRGYLRKSGISAVSGYYQEQIVQIFKELGDFPVIARSDHPVIARSEATKQSQEFRTIAEDAKTISQSELEALRRIGHDTVLSSQRDEPDLAHPFRAASAFRLSRWIAFLGVGFPLLAIWMKIHMPGMPLWQVLTLVFAGVYFMWSHFESEGVGNAVYQTLIDNGRAPIEALTEIVAKATPVGVILEPVFKLIKSEKIKQEIIKHEYAEHKVLEYLDKHWSLRELFMHTQVAHKIAMFAMLPGIGALVTGLFAGKSAEICSPILENEAAREIKFEKFL
ncbi:hypothetical protein KKG22_06215, partial [Patescibacteria group bacterium]|nr:hypothetical protein [Patescibacteria group bacterium]